MEKASGGGAGRKRSNWWMHSRQAVAAAGVLFGRVVLVTRAYILMTLEMVWNLSTNIAARVNVWPQEVRGSPPASNGPLIPILETSTFSVLSSHLCAERLLGTHLKAQWRLGQ